MFFEDIVFKNIGGNSVNLFKPDEGLEYGNMFKDLYKGYKHYKVRKINANNEKELILLKLYEYDFAVNDLSLYLDLHPEDSTTYNLFKKYTEEYNALMNKYENMYGPLELNQSDYQSYEWYKNPWPFEGVDL